MVHSNGDPLRPIPTKKVSESFPLGERIRLSKQSEMNSSLPKRTVSPRVKPSQVRCSPSVATMSQPSEHLEERMLQTPLPSTPTVDVFCTGK
jgi:hypothetical protein